MKCAGSMEDHTVLITQDGLWDQDVDESPKLLHFKHPRTNCSALYAKSSNGQHIFEVLQFSDSFRSFFIEENVLQNGSIAVLTEIDTVFLMMPYLLQSAKSGKFVPLDNILIDSDFPDLKILPTLPCPSLDAVADTKVCGGDIRACRLNKEKCMGWLKEKITSLSEALKSNAVKTKVGQSSVFSANSEDSNENEDDIKKYAHGILSEYLPAELAVELRDALGIKEESDHGKREIDSDSPESLAKKVKVSSEPTDDYTKIANLPPDSAKEKTPLTRTQKSLLKVDKTGMKSITSFFCKSSKK